MMSPTSRIDVEPLSDARWEKIEQRVLAKLDGEEAAPAAAESKRGRTWGWKPAAALVLAGAVAAAIGAIATRSAWPTERIASPSRIVTAGAESHVALGEAAIDVGPDSAVVVSGDDEHGVVVVLDRGRVECEVAPRENRPPFLVQAGDVRVRVVGTHFTVSRPNGAARVDVSRGVVEVISRGETVRVRAGESWPLLSLPSSSPTVAAPVAPAPAPLSAAADPTRVAPPRSQPAPHPVPVRSGRSASASAPLAPAALPPASTQRPPTALGAREPQAPAITAPPAGPSLQELYESAAKLEATRPDEALARYRSVAAGSSVWSANALFAEGRLQADRGQRAEARRLLNEYLARFPGGSNAADAKDLLERVR